MTFAEIGILAEGERRFRDPEGKQGGAQKGTPADLMQFAALAHKGQAASTEGSEPVLPKD